METEQRVSPRAFNLPKKEVLSGAFFWLGAFYFVYCARPEDWVPGMGYLPLAKITSILALVALAMSFGRTKRGARDIPRECVYLGLMIGVMFVAALTSPVWRLGSLLHTLDFSKVWVAWVLTYLLITTFTRLRQIIFIQAGSVAVVALVSILKGHGTARLEGVLNGIYSNSNDLAFAIVLALPFCLAFLLTAKGGLRKLIWGGAMLVMCAALFLTASRAGFIDLVISGSVCLWYFGVKGRRPQLIVAAVLVLATMLIAVGGLLRARFMAVVGKDVDPTEQSAYGSFEERKFLYFKSFEAIEHHPLLGVGPHCFANYSGIWKVVHNAYLQIGAEAGIPALILYLLFLGSAFKNLKLLRKRGDLDVHTTLFVGALHSSLIGFAVGAMFAPSAYNFFPYFAVAQTSVLMAIVREKDASVAAPELVREPSRHLGVYARTQPSKPIPSLY
ncbi:MAG: O-antigen ligase family protein [Candidatus Sulfotelmatobacter sp.]